MKKRLLILIQLLMIVIIIVLSIYVSYLNNQLNLIGNHQISRQRKILNIYMEHHQYESALSTLEEMIIQSNDDRLFTEFNKIIERYEEEKVIRIQQDKNELNQLLSRIELKVDQQNKKNNQTLFSYITKNTDNLINLLHKKDQPDYKMQKQVNDLLSTGFDYYQLGLYDKAKDIFISLLEVENNNDSALAYLADIYLKTNNGDNRDLAIALDYAQKSLKVNNKNELAILTKARAYRMRNLNDLAVEYYQEVIKLNPENIQAFYELAETFYVLKNYKESLPLYQYIIEKNPEYNKENRIEKKIAEIKSKI